MKSQQTDLLAAAQPVIRRRGVLHLCFELMLNRVGIFFVRLDFHVRRRIVPATLLC
jgi:hypothetical protein